MTRTHLIKIGIFLFTMLLAAGCAITPQPMTTDEIEQRRIEDMQNLFAEQEPVNGPISLYEAMARSLKYNLDHRLKLMEDALAARELEAARWDLLPRLTAAAGYSERDNESGSRSQSLTTGEETLEYSTSREKAYETLDLTMMWNVLDFGVTYYRAKQQADRVLIVDERRRKVIQNLMRDVRHAYFRAYSAQELIGAMQSHLQRSQKALANAHQITEQRLKPPREALEYERALLENARTIRSLIRELATAKTELAALMNLSPGTPFELAAPQTGEAETPQLNTDIPALEEMALRLRPELREEDYKARISVAEARKALVEMLPGLDLNVGYNYDSNEYLFNNDWWSAGVKISLNIFNLISGPAKYRAAQTREQVDIMRRRALSMSVLTQVHLAYQRFHLETEEYELYRRLDDVNHALSAHIEGAQDAGGVGELAAIRAATYALIAKMRRHLSYANLQNALGRLYNSVGLDLLPEEIESPSLDALSQAIEAAHQQAAL